MVNIDTVYQTVLALANKEQRGYITPQEFNLFANLAQMEIFEQYFYDLNQFKRGPSQKDRKSDTAILIEDKIKLFQKVLPGTSFTTPPYNFPADFYRFVSITSDDGYEMEVMSKEDFSRAKSLPLLMPTISRPICYLKKDSIEIAPSEAFSTYNFSLNYIAKPKKPNWTYVVINGTALWNPSAVDINGEPLPVHFELHASEQKTLVLKILQLAGVSIKDYNVAQLAAQKESSEIQQEKS